MSSLNRRQFGAVVVGGTASVAALVTQVDTSEATVSGTLDIADTEKAVSTPVTDAFLNITGQYQYEASSRPDKIILRLEMERGDREQIASEIHTPNAAANTKDYAFNTSLLEHSNITAPKLSPTDAGNSKSIEATAYLTIEIRNNGSTIAETTVQDTFTVQVTQEKKEATVTIGGTGDVEIKT